MYEVVEVPIMVMFTIIAARAGAFITVLQISVEHLQMLRLVFKVILGLFKYHVISVHIPWQ